MTTRSKAPLGATAFVALASSAAFGGVDLFQDGRFVAATGDLTPALTDFAPFDEPDKITESGPNATFNAARVALPAPPASPEAYLASAGQASSLDTATMALSVHAWAAAAQRSTIGAPASSGAWSLVYFNFDVTTPTAVNWDISMAWRTQSSDFDVSTWGDASPFPDSWDGGEHAIDEDGGVLFGFGLTSELFGAGGSSVTSHEIADSTENLAFNINQTLAPGNYTFIAWLSARTYGAIHGDLAGASHQGWEFAVTTVPAGPTSLALAAGALLIGRRSRD